MEKAKRASCKNREVQRCRYKANQKPFKKQQKNQEKIAEGERQQESGEKEKGRKQDDVKASSTGHEKVGKK